MPRHSTLTRWQQPRESYFRDIGKKGFTMFFGVGISNPFGPTLSVVGTDGIFKERALLPVIFLGLNPFNQECKIVGEASVGGTWNALRDLSQFFSLLSGSSCPNLLLPVANLQQHEVIDLYAHLLMRFQDAGEMLAKVRRHPRDPWTRVQEDMNGLTDIIKTGQSKNKVVQQPRRYLEVGEAKELATTQLKPENVKAELEAFFFAWKGSIEFTGLSRIALSFENFLHTLSRLTPDSVLMFSKNKDT